MADSTQDHDNFTNSRTGAYSIGGRLITLEEFIIDTFTRVGDDGVEEPINRPDEIGGGGSYGIIGARMFLPTSRLGMIVDHTSDTLPAEMRGDLEVYGKDMWVFREREDGQPTTRSVNRYKGDLRGFEYLSTPRLLTPVDILDTPWAWGNAAKSSSSRGGERSEITAIHMISDAQRLESFEEDMERVRAVVGTDWDPKIVWEPNPADATPTSIPLFRRITPLVDILTPNHSEVLKLLSLTEPDAADPGHPTCVLSLKVTLEAAAQTLLSWNPRIGVVIRVGSLGACHISHGMERAEWMRAYWSEDAGEGWEAKVVDPTGAGNAGLWCYGCRFDRSQGIERR